MSDSRLDPGPGKNSYKRLYWDNWWNLNMDHGLENSIVSMWNVCILKIALWLWKRKSFFLRKCTVKHLGEGGINLLEVGMGLQPILK